MRRPRLIALGLAVLAGSAGMAVPAAATSAEAVRAFDDLCLDGALSGRQVAPIAEAWGIKMERRPAIEEDATAPGRKPFKMLGVRLRIESAEILSGDWFLNPISKGIYSLFFYASKQLAVDPEGRRFAVMQCSVFAHETPGMARPLSEVRSELRKMLPQEAIAGEPTSRLTGGNTYATIQWDWGSLESDAGQTMVKYSSNGGLDYLSKGYFRAIHVTRAAQ